MFARYRISIAEAKTEWKQNGFRSLVRRYGWKVLAVIFTTYLVRDVTLYILLPWFVARSVISN